MPTVHIGDLRIDTINDAQIMADTGGPFGLVPRALWSRTYTPDEHSRVPMVHNCLLVRSGERTIVVDTGIGSRVGEKAARHMGLTHPDGTLLDGLARLGVAPAEVDLVINTHLHADHCGGNLCEGPDGELRPTFPNAEYWVQRREAADAMFPNERTQATYYRENFVPLVDSGQMRLLDGNIEVVPGMRLALTPGHTPAHMSVVFEAGDQAALYVADLASMWVNFANLAWMTAYDVEPLVTLETKRIWQQWVLDRGALVIFEHDPLITVGRMVEQGDRLTVVDASGEVA